MWYLNIDCPVEIQYKVEKRLQVLQRKHVIQLTINGHELWNNSFDY